MDKECRLLFQEIISRIVLDEIVGYCNIVKPLTYYKQLV